MSFEVYVQSFENGQPAGIPREVIRQTFGTFLSAPEPDYWHLAYGPNESCSLALSALSNAPEQIHNVTVERPCPNPQLWQGLAQLLNIGNTILYFPGGVGPLLRSQTVTSHLPLGMLSALGTPLVVSSGAEILGHISAA